MKEKVLQLDCKEIPSSLPKLYSFKKKLTNTKAKPLSPFAVTVKGPQDVNSAGYMTLWYQDQSGMYGGAPLWIFIKISR